MDAGCSFCSTRPVVAWFEGPDFLTSVRSADGVRAEEAWLCCANCLRLVHNNDRERIVQRGTLRVGGSGPDEALAAVRTEHERFWAARQGADSTWRRRS
jgi:hypothetical protein